MTIKAAILTIKPVPLDLEHFYGWLNPPLARVELYDADRLFADQTEVTAEVYDHFLEMMPPMYFTGRSFAICEARTGDIRLAFFQVDGRYFAAHISDSDPEHSMKSTREKVRTYMQQVSA